MTSAIPEFGVVAPGAEYILRPGGYSVILGEFGEVATVSTPSGSMLPGGGQNEGEPPEQAAIRETKEECGLDISLGTVIGIADELVFARDEGKHYRKRCTFFLAEVTAMSGQSEPDHELVWLPPQSALARLLYGSQRWAISEAFRLSGRVAAACDVE